MHMKTNMIKKPVNKSCVPCHSAGSALHGAALKQQVQLLGPTWKVVKDHHLEREFKFKDFVEALAFTNRIGALAEEQGHHPDINLAWGRVKITGWTHSVDGLTENDFVLASLIEQLNPA